MYPTFGLAGEYHLTRNLELEANGSGFTIPHHDTIADAEGSINYRLGSVELVAAEKFYHFKTSTQNTEYFKTTLSGIYAAVRWYPDKVSVPCFFCKGGTAAAKTESAASPPKNQSTVTRGPGSSGSSAKPDQGGADQGDFVRRVSGGGSRFRY
jgi:hypothetical protein